MISLTRVPTIIDPLTPALEVLVQTSSGIQQQLPRIDLTRLDYTAEELPFVADPSCCNVYGDKATVTESQVLLIYAHNGRLTATGVRGEGKPWEVVPVDEEVSGAIVDRPSVRLTFDTEDAAARFDSWLASQMNKKSRIGTFLRERLLQSPVIVPVAHKRRVCSK